MNSESGDNDIAQLLARSGRRPEPSAAARARVHRELLDVWEELPDAQVQTAAVQESPPSTSGKRFVSFAMAAAISMAAIGAWFGWNLLNATAVPAASIAFSTGGYSVTPAGDGTSLLPSGTTVRTSDEGRVLLTVDARTTVRLDQNTRATLRSAEEIYLHTGRLYVDSHGGADNMRITTSKASVSKVGTQFEVAVRNEALEIAVREGQIRVARGGTETLASARNGQGDVVRYDRLGNQTKSTVATSDSQRWYWTQLSRPDFDMSQGSYYQYLSWAARERGLTLQFEDEILEQFAKSQFGVGRYDASDADIEHALRTEQIYRRVPAAAHELRVGRR